MEKVLIEVDIDGETYTQEVAPNNPKGYTKKDVQNAHKWVVFFKKQGCEAKVVVL